MCKATCDSVEFLWRRNHIWIPVLHICQHANTNNYMSCVRDGSVRATVASNTHTTGCMYSHTPTFVMWALWWGFVPGGITSAAPLQYPQSAGVTPHEARRGGGDIQCGAARAKALLNTYVDGTNTRVRERSPVQSHVALHHIHQHSALSSRALPPNSARLCQTPVSQPKRTSQEGKCLPIHCSPVLSLF